MKEQRATDKQLVFIKLIMDETGYKFNLEHGTKEEASKYISEHIDAYKEICAERNFNLWAFEHE